MRIYNGTQHEINIYAISDCVEVGRKLVIKNDAEPILVIEPGTNLNCTKGNAATPTQFNNWGIPLVGAVCFTAYDPIPDNYDLIIVSNLYRSAVNSLGGDSSKLATVNGVVYQSETDMKPCGCTSLAVG